MNEEVKAGYKQTEAGMIPEDWKVTTVGKEFSIQLGKMLDSEKNTGTPKPYLGNRAVQWGRIYLDDIGSIKLTASDLRRFRLRDGDLLVCEGGEVGRSAIWREPMAECYYQKALHRLRPKQGYNIELMGNLLQWLSSKGFLANYVTQTSIAHLPKDKFETLPIPLPPTKAEQEAIAEALSDADALIESLEQLIAKKRAIKQGAMQELLTGKRRLPGFEGEWKEKQLGDIAAFLSGGTPSRSNDDYWTGNIPWISATSLRCFYIFRSDANVTKEAVVAGSKMAPVGSTLLLVRGSALHKEILSGLVSESVCFNQDVKALVPSSQIVPIFLTFVMLGRSEELLKLVSSAGNTAGVLDTKLLKAFEILLPPLSEQNAIAEVLSAMDAEIEALETKLTKARQIKQGMMHNLLTGRIRLV